MRGDGKHGSCTAYLSLQKKDSMVIVHETSPPLTDGQHVKRIFPRLISDDSEVSPPSWQYIVQGDVQHGLLPLITE